MLGLAALLLALVGGCADDSGPPARDGGRAGDAAAESGSRSDLAAPAADRGLDARLPLPPSGRTFRVQGKVSYLKSKPSFGAQERLSFIMHLRPLGGARVKAVIGPDCAPGAAVVAAPWTETVQGELVGDRLTIEPLKIGYGLYCRTPGLYYDTWYAKSYALSTFRATYDRAGDKLTGRLAGKVSHVVSDTYDSYEISGSFSAGRDTDKPTAKVAYLSAPTKLGPYDAVKVGFSEPLRAPAGKGSLTVRDGATTVISYRFAPPSGDRDGARSLLTLRPKGHLPLGKKLTVEIVDFEDLAGHALGKQRLSFDTIADPGLLSAAGNSGFEGGDLDGWLVIPTRCITAVGSANKLPTKTGQYAALWDGIQACKGLLGARLKLPATARSVTLALDALSPYSGSASIRASLVVSTATAIKRTSLQSLFSSKTLTPLATPSKGYTHHTGYVAVTADVSSFAGQEVLLSIEQPSACTLFCNKAGLLVDELQVR